MELLHLNIFEHNSTNSVKFNSSKELTVIQGTMLFQSLRKRLIRCNMPVKVYSKFLYEYQIPTKKVRHY